jgi:hypothetical protein
MPLFPNSLAKKKQKQTQKQTQNDNPAENAKEDAVGSDGRLVLPAAPPLVLVAKEQGRRKPKVKKGATTGQQLGGAVVAGGMVGLAIAGPAGAAAAAAGALVVASTSAPGGALLRQCGGATVTITKATFSAGRQVVDFHSQHQRLVVNGDGDDEDSNRAARQELQDTARTELVRTTEQVVEAVSGVVHEVQDILGHLPGAGLTVALARPVVRRVAATVSSAAAVGEICCASAAAAAAAAAKAPAP